MNGPARLDLLIPVARPHGQGSHAQERFDELLRKDEHRSGAGTGKAPADTNGRRSGEPVWDDRQAQPLAAAGPAQGRSVDSRSDVYLAYGPSAKPERVYAAHLLAGDYLATKGSDAEARPGLDPGRPLLDLAEAFASAAPVEVASVAVSGTTAMAEAMPASELAPAATVFASQQEDDVARNTAACAEAGGDRSGASTPAWLPQMARLSVSPAGVVTLWIRDFAAGHDDLADRVAELRGRAVSDGMRIGVVMVNGRPWNQDHHGKENDA